MTLSSVKKVRIEVTAYQWTCDGCGRVLQMTNERALLKLIERHQAADEKKAELHKWAKDVKAHISGRGE